mgnify:CR=1 FL=1
MLGVFVLAGARLAALTEPDRVMVAFGLPALVLVSVLAIWVHAYANWAAVAFVPAAVLTAPRGAVSPLPRAESPNELPVAP